MIQLTCTNCRALLVMDDAFAGGVCRCKHCGTIQTVPKPSKRQAAPGVGASGAAATTDTGQSRTLFQRPSGVGTDVPGSGTGLDELANVVASSGLSGTGLQSGRLRQRGPEGAGAGVGAAAAGAKGKTEQKKKVMVAGAIGGAMVLSALVTWLAMRPGEEGAANRNGTAVAVATGTSRGASGGTVQAQGGDFLGVPLTGRTVVYVLDRGSGTRQTFDHLKEAAFRSVEGLPPGTRFQVLFWQVDLGGETPTHYPANGPIAATKEHAQAARATLGDVGAFGQSKVEPALARALAGNPEEVVLATGKYGLEPEVVEQVTKLRGSSRVKIHTFALGEAGTGTAEVLRKIAERTGGEFREVPMMRLREAAE